MKIHTIVLGHGSRNQNTVGEFQETIARYQLLYPEDSVSCAFIEFSKPTLEEEIDRLSCEACLEKIVIVPLFLSIGNHLTNHLPDRLAEIQKKHPKLSLVLGRHIGADPLLCNIIKVRSDEMKR